VRQRSNLLVLLGIAFFLIGGAIVYLVVRADGGGSSASAADSGSVPVLVATADVAPGTLGADLLKQGRVTVKQVPAGQRLADALVTQSQLSGQITTSAFGKGEQLRQGGMRPQSMRSQALKIPGGYEGVAVQVDFVAGGAGYVAPGDKVNVYAVMKDSSCGTQPCPYPTPRSQLLLSNVDVLDVSQEVAPRRGQATPTNDSSMNAAVRPTGSGLTYLLALKTGDAEKVIFQTEFERLYLSLTAEDAAPASSGGHDGRNLFG
jgi:pilus assembly protein CpaB